MQPYISFVIGFRNDNYTPNANEKFNVTLNTLVEQLDKAFIPSEIIVVDWNTPDPQKPLAEVIDLHASSRFVSVVVYEVDAHVHERYLGHEHIGLIGEVCANVGIRRARGEFVLNKTSDTFFSNKLINLCRKSYYQKMLFTGRIELK